MNIPGLQCVVGSLAGLREGRGHASQKLVEFWTEERITMAEREMEDIWPPENVWAFKVVAKKLHDKFANTHKVLQIEDALQWHGVPAMRARLHMGGVKPCDACVVWPR